MAFISIRRGTRPTHVPCLALSNILQISSLGRKTCINLNLTRQTHPPACIQFVPVVNYTGHVWNYVLAVRSPLQAMYKKCACHVFSQAGYRCLRLSAHPCRLCFHSVHAMNKDMCCSPCLSANPYRLSVKNQLSFSPVCSPLQAVCTYCACRKLHRPIC